MERTVTSLTPARRILVADDDSNDQQLILRAFRKLGLEAYVDVVPDGQRVLDYLNREGEYAARPHGQPAVVVLDVKMPHVGGLQALEAIRQHPDLHALPVVMLTSSREPDDIEKAYNAGANAFVVKPTAFSVFVETVARLAAFWARTNEPPITRSKHDLHPPALTQTH